MFHEHPNQALQSFFQKIDSCDRLSELDLTCPSLNPTFDHSSFTCLMYLQAKMLPDDLGIVCGCSYVDVLLDTMFDPPVPYMFLTFQRRSLLRHDRDATIFFLQMFPANTEIIDVLLFDCIGKGERREHTTSLGTASNTVTALTNYVRMDDVPPDTPLLPRHKKATGSAATFAAIGMIAILKWGYQETEHLVHMGVYECDCMYAYTGKVQQCARASTALQRLQGEREK